MVFPNCDPVILALQTLSWYLLPVKKSIVSSVWPCGTCSEDIDIIWDCHNPPFAARLSHHLPALLQGEVTEPPWALVSSYVKWKLACCGD